MERGIEGAREKERQRQIKRVRKTDRQTEE